MIQRSAARLCFNNYSREVSVTRMIENLDWFSVDDYRLITRLKMMFRITHNLVDIDHGNHLTKPTRQTRQTHPFSYIQAQTSSTVYANSFFPWTIPHWNSLPNELLDITDYDSFKDSLKDHFKSK